MNCKQVKKKLLFYLDNELAESEKQAVELHLATCRDCQDEIKELAATQNLLRQRFQALATETVPPWAWVELEPRLAMLSKQKASRSKRIAPSIKSFVSWQPAWKPIVSAVLAVAIIISSVLYVPRLMGSSPEELAMRIAAEDPEVEAVLQDLPSAQEAKTSGQTAYVLNQSLSGESALAYVDLPSMAIVKVFRLVIPQLTEEEKTGIVNLAATDLNIQSFMDIGGTIEEVYLISPLFRIELIDGEPHVWLEGMLAEVVLRVESQTWIARVDIRENRVMHVSQPAPPPRPFVHIKTPHSMEEIIKIAKSDVRVSELFEQGAEIVSVAAGGREVEDKGVVVLKLGDEMVMVRIELSREIVTAVETVPTASWQKGYFFKAEP